MQSTQEFLGLVGGIDIGMRHVTVELRHLVLEGIGAMHVGEFGLKQLTVQSQVQVRCLLKLPVNVLDRVQPKTRQSILRDLFSEMQQQQEGSLRVSIKDNLVVGISNPNVAPVCNGIVVDAICKGLPRAALACSRVYHGSVGENGAFSLDFRIPLVSAEPRTGDVVEAGFSIRHSPTGDIPTRIDTSAACFLKALTSTFVLSVEVF